MTKKEALNKLKEKHLEMMAILYPSFPKHAIPMPNEFSRAGTTNGLTQCIITYCNLKGWQAERISSSGRVIQNKKVIQTGFFGAKTVGANKYIPGTSQKGTADISATINGQAVKIEVKNKNTKDRMSDDQKRYQENVEFSGAIYYIAKTLQDVIEFLDTFPDNPKKIEYWKWKKERSTS